VILNHDPDPIGAHVDFIYGRTNDLINAVPSNSNSISGQLHYPDGFLTGTAQHLYEFTATYEYKWVEGLLARVEYRGDFFNEPGADPRNQIPGECSWQNRKHLRCRPRWA